MRKIGILDKEALTHTGTKKIAASVFARGDRIHVVFQSIKPSFFNSSSIRETELLCQEFHITAPQSHYCGAVFYICHTT